MPTPRSSSIPIGEARAPRTPDLVVPVNGPGGDAGTLKATASQITQVPQPAAQHRACHLDVIAQSSRTTSFWYFCVPNDQTVHLESCGNTTIPR